MSYISEHRRMKPVLDAARRLDIATNPAPEAIFEAGNGGFQVWCTPDDHPQGWDDVPMIAGAFSKPCSFLASVYWEWDGDKITHLVLSTNAYDLSDYLDDDRYQAHNRPEDIEWAKKKICDLFTLASVPMFPIRITK